MPPKSAKAAKGKQKAQEEQREESLQAVVLADSFETRFRPFTLERPRCLLPLANTPLIEYTLEFLASAGVQDVFVYTGEHADQVEDYINASKWKLPSSPFRNLTILRSSASSIGDYMRDLDNRDLIAGDFLVVSGDVVANIDVGPILARHRARREKDKNAIMTMVLREIGINHRSKSKARRPVFVINPKADRCLHYEELGHRRGGPRHISLDPDLLKEHGEIEVREDLIDCHIDICTPDVLAQWSENFDYQSLRKSFLFGVLKDYELNGKTIHTHILTDQYAARVKNLRAYDATSRDIAGRWTFPYCPDSNMLPSQTYRLRAGKNYIENGVALGVSSTLKGRNIVGGESRIGDGSVITNSTLGRRCKVGRNVRISNSYLWDDVVIGDNSTIDHSIVAGQAKIGSNCSIEPGSLLSFSTHVPEAKTIAGKSLRGGTNAGEEYAPSDSDSDASENDFRHLFYRNPSTSSSASSMSTLTSQISDGSMDGDLDASASRRSSVFSDPSDAEAAQKSRDFHAEATSSILDGLTKGDAADTIFLELNGYRMSVDADQHAVRSSVVSAFMKRIAQLTDSGGKVSDSVHTVFSKYKTLIDRVILDQAAAEKSDQIDFLLCVQKEIVGKPKGGDLLVFVAKELYELDLVEEDGVLQWWADERSSKGDLESVKGATQQFITYLQEAEEESDEEESAEGEEDESE